jgi:hypothetical protein
MSKFHSTITGSLLSCQVQTFNFFVVVEWTGGVYPSSEWYPVDQNYQPGGVNNNYQVPYQVAGLPQGYPNAELPQAYPGAGPPQVYPGVYPENYPAENYYPDVPLESANGESWDGYLPQGDPNDPW